MRYIHFLICTMLLLFVGNAVSADSTNTGVISKGTPTGIVFTTGERYKLYPSVPITLKDGTAGKVRDIHPGDRVRVALDDAGRIVSATILAPLVTHLVEHSLTKDTPVSGEWEAAENVAIAGRIFDIAGTMIYNNGRGRWDAVFSNRDHYDRFEAWVGKQDASGQGTNTFIVLGDGQELFRSPPMSERSPAIKVSVPIKGYSGVSLIVQQSDDVYIDSHAVWGTPVFIKMPTNLPELLYPGENEKISQTTVLLWKAVDGATGYLLELQCVKNDNPQPGDDDNSFITKHIAVGTTTYNFDANKMPKGKWQWRVHALSKSGFLGHMDEWRVFYSQ